MELPLPTVAAGDPQRAARVAWILAGILLALGALRLFLLVTHAPLAGYANQYDMIRTSSCVGLWPAQDGAPTAAHPQAPVARYVAGARDPSACVPSTEAAWIAFAALAPALDLRVVGASQALALLAIALWLHRRLRAHPGAQLAHATFFAVVLADPFDTLWLNTLYTEAPALIGAYLASAGLLASALEARATRGSALAFLIGIAMLGASRVPHLLLPFAWLALLAVVLFRRGLRRRALLATGLVLAVSTAALQVGVMRAHAALAPANRSDALFGALLPAAADPVSFNEKLGLPPHCVELTHTTWYLRRGRDAPAECPEAFALGQGRIFAALATEPRLTAVALLRGLVLATAWRVPYLGELAGADYARVPPGAAGLLASLADPLASLSLASTLVLWLTPLVAGLIAALRLLLVPRGAREVSLLAVDALLALAAAAIAGVWVVSVLGDGYSEVARHLNLAQNFVLLAWLLLIGAGAAGVRARSRWRAWPPIALGSLAVAALLARGVPALPLAFGALQQPATDTVAGEVVLAGLALDARGIARIEARVDDVATPLALAPSAAIARQFPIAGGDAGREFSGPLQLSDRADKLEIVVTNRDGVETVIDRRWIQSKSF